MTCSCSKINKDLEEKITTMKPEDKIWTYATPIWDSQDEKKKENLKSLINFLEDNSIGFYERTEGNVGAIMTPTQIKQLAKEPYMDDITEWYNDNPDCSF